MAGYVMKMNTLVSNINRSGQKDLSSEVRHKAYAPRYAQAEMKTVILIISFLISIVCFGQNDTIYLFENHIELNGLEYNLIENDIKTGNWIEFSIEDNTFIASLGSGDNVHFHYNIYTEYRPLKNGEYNGTEILTTQNAVDTVNGELIYSGNYLKIVNRVPPDKYHITGKGIYKSDRKQGQWIYLHENGKLNKEIYYKNGLPEKGFNIYRPNETIMIEVIKMNNDEWKIIKYSESGKKLDQEIKKTIEIKTIF